MSNMTWEDGVKHFFSTIFARPQMWPVGYILGSPYSPLRLERLQPERNWRDPFEDLLAIEAGRPMIREESRTAEDRHISRSLFEFASANINACNSETQRFEKIRERAQEMYRAHVERNEHHDANYVKNEHLPLFSIELERLANQAQNYKTHFEARKDSTATSLKPRGHWIASLMTSGALPTWSWSMHNSLDGPVMGFHKRDASSGGITMSELEIKQHFEGGQPHGFGTPTSIPSLQLKAVIDGTYPVPSFGLTGYHSDEFFKDLRPSKTSIISQWASSESIKLPDGSTGSKVVMSIQRADGTIINKEFIQQPEKVLEEIRNARLSMEQVRKAVKWMSEDPSIYGLAEGELVGQGKAEVLSLEAD